MENQINISPLNPPEKESGQALKGALRTNEAHFRELGVKKTTLKFPNLLLIAGNGRNVGKTTLACKIISWFSAEKEVVGLKISPHFYEFNEADVVFKNKQVAIVEEKKIDTKDSSLMLQAGAKKVYFVMVKPEHLHRAVEHMIKILPNKLIVCESGGLHEYVNPGLFLMVNRKGKEIVKTNLLQYDPIIVNNDGKNFDFDIHQVEFKNHQIKLK